jgi:hypothetical protein
MTAAHRIRAGAAFGGRGAGTGRGKRHPAPDTGGGTLAAAARLEAVNERVRVVAERDALTRDVRAYARDGACSTVP